MNYTLFSAPAAHWPLAAVSYQENNQGSFERSVLLPAEVQSDKAKAGFDNGVLTVSLPKAEQVRPKTISIKAK